MWTTTHTAPVTVEVIWIKMDRMSFTIGLNWHFLHFRGWPEDTISHWEAEHHPEWDFNCNRSIGRLVLHLQTWFVQSLLPTGIPILYYHDLRLRFPGRQINCEETISFCIKVKLLPKMKQLSSRANPSGSLISVKMHEDLSISLHTLRSNQNPSCCHLYFKDNSMS